ncbi:MAG TPA: DUF4440 domain-containing protein [Candidatus Sulfotelmatobacter sp.]
MTSDGIFTYIDGDSLGVLEQLRRREPIFHAPEFCTTLADYDRVIAPHYWEVGASGRRYSREFILRTLSEKHSVDTASEGWQSYDHGLRRLGSDTYLLTYTLRQGSRLTRRATIWQSTSEGWRILYHQGTIVAADEDDVVPTTSSSD